MKKSGWICLAVLILALAAFPQGLRKGLEPAVYQENFETNELSAWASYPLWQDTAFDPNIRPDTLVPGDSNISLCERVTPYTNVDSYAGAQKLLDMYFLEDSSLAFRVYLKTHLKPESLKVRLAAGDDGTVDYTVLNPSANAWLPITVRYADFIAENPALKGRIIKINALAVLAKFPGGDPSMPVYFGLDDVVFHGARAALFQFAEPKMHKLSEWKPYIPDRHYGRGDVLSLRGEWPFAADRVDLSLAGFTDKSRTLLRSGLRQKGGEWLGSIRLALPEGLYLVTLTAFSGREKISDTEFTIFIDRPGLAGRHPRLWFNSADIGPLKARFSEERFKAVREGLLKDAKQDREKNPVEKLVFDIDCFPNDEPLIGNVPRSLDGWFERIDPWTSTLHTNALAYALLDDQEAGQYGKKFLAGLCRFPFWVHPWFERRGQHIYYPVGELAMEAALAYDLLYDLMSDAERRTVREGLFRNMVAGCQKGYVEDNLVTNSTSNWVAHITSGSLMCQAAVFGDAPAERLVEPYLTGTLLKLADLISRSIGRDGGYGESLGYCYFTMLSLSKSLPALENVFKIDLSGNLHLTYEDMLWAGLIKKKLFFYFGDGGGTMDPMTSWTWLLAKDRDPRLAWLFNHLKSGETLMDVIYNTDGIPLKDPFAGNPVRVFRDLGTTVFKSGWKEDDFVFVMRTGAFFNHQHIDQGTFWLADKGSIFIQERHGGDYYDDPFYQSHYTQPVGHSTILIDHNEQSQRAGDPLLFAEGFRDCAFVHQFLDGQEAAFVSGDIGRLYWGKVKEMRRNVLYLKPRAVLMLDTVVPNDKDADVTLLYQAGNLKDIAADAKASRITKEKGRLTISHLFPETMKVTPEKTPIYIHTLKERYPLEAEGMLTVTSRTQGRPLLLANLLTTEPESLRTQPGNGCILGSWGGQNFAFSTSPGEAYSVQDMTTDALAISWKGSRVFAALCTSLKRGGAELLRSSAPVTCEIGASGMKYCLAKPGTITLHATSRPRQVVANGRPAKFRYEEKTRLLTLAVGPGEGSVDF
jgi:hypothetical protein